MSKEAMKLAKAWFERNTYGDEAVDVYEALCEALAEQPAQQEPLTDEHIERIYHRYGGDMINCARAIERAAQRTWVGLTDEEIEKLNCVYPLWDDGESCTIMGIKDFARAIETAHGIKENT